MIRDRCYHRVVKMIRATKTLNHILTPMGSINEGEWEEVMQLLDRIKGKVESVEEKLTE